MRLLIYGKVEVERWIIYVFVCLLLLVPEVNRPQG